MNAREARGDAGPPRSPGASRSPLAPLLLLALALGSASLAYAAAPEPSSAGLRWEPGPDASEWARAEGGMLHVQGIAGASVRADAAAFLTNQGLAPATLQAVPVGGRGVLAYELHATRVDGERVVLDLREGTGQLVLAPGERVVVGVLLQLADDAPLGLLTPHLPTR